MKELRMPNEEELAEVVFKYCRTNNITYIREDELVKKIADEEMKKNIEQLKNEYNLDEKGWGKDKESQDAVTTYMGNLLMFTYKLSKRFYDVIDILIDECKANREKKEGERLYYLTFYLNPLDIERIQLIKSRAEIYAEDLYNYCKTNNIEYLKKDELSSIMDATDYMIDKAVDLLMKKYMIDICWIDNNCYLIFFLTQSKIELNKNQKLLIKNLAESLLDICNQNDIKYLELDELKNYVETDDDLIEKMLNYLTERHLADIQKNIEDGKEYLCFYE